MKKLVAALLALTPTLAMASEGDPSMGGCDHHVRLPIPDRPDCLGYNPFYSQSSGGLLEGPSGSVRGQGAERPRVRRRR